MKIYQNPDPTLLRQILARPTLETGQLDEVVSSVLQAVKAEGDAALRRYTERFDRSTLTHIEVTPAEMAAAASHLSHELKAAIQLAHDNIAAFHRQQQSPIEVVETMPGVRCWRKSVGIEKVGLYIPGGTAPLFSTVLMLAVPAQLAGCRELILCTPPRPDGSIHPAIRYAAGLAGVTRLFKVGGAQAIAAMAYGTETVPQVYKIFGPGNQYVTAAKQLVNRAGTAIDMPAGPSEVLVLADDTAKPAFVAADLLSQAEHGSDSQVVLLTYSAAMAAAVQAAIAEQLPQLPRRQMAEQALSHSVAIVVDTEAAALHIINEYAPEHLILATQNPEIVAAQVVNAGSVFMGHYTPESVGDYASGTNHTLPTNGHARAYSGVSLDSFVKKITFQQLTREGLQGLGPAVAVMAEAEELHAHALAVTLRLGE